MLSSNISASRRSSGRESHDDIAGHDDVLTFQKDMSQGVPHPHELKIVVRRPAFVSVDAEFYRN